MAPNFQVATLAVLAAVGSVRPAAAQQAPEPAAPQLSPESSAPAAEAPSPPPSEIPQNLPPPPPPRSAGNGGAAPAPLSGEAAPAIQVETPPPGPIQRRRGYRVHDGFYLRLALGLGTGQAAVSTDSNASPDYDFEGGSGVFQALVGGTPTPGLTVGGLLFLASLGADRIQVEGSDVTNSTNGQYGMLGAFVDGFPDPTGGLHIGGSVGLAGAKINPDDNTVIDDFDGGGVGLGAWVGYDAWISSEWSLGGQLQLFGVLARQSESGLTKDARAGGISLVFTSLFH